MKKMMFIAMLFATSTTFAAPDREVIIPESKLPAQSRTFLKNHFAGVEVVSVLKEVDDLEKDYSVYLNNGLEVDFRRNGAWDQVEGYRHALPESILGLLPDGIAAYTTANFPGQPIVKVNRERWGYEIELAPKAGSHYDVELDFTNGGKFFRYDD
jgi:hypothetical protein